MISLKISSGNVSQAMFIFCSISVLGLPEPDIENLDYGSHTSTVGVGSEPELTNN